MKYSFDWLKEYVSDIPTVEKTAQIVGLKSFELEGKEQLDNGDTIIEWDILPNRSSDCLCYLGMAKEISTVFGLDFNSKIKNFNGSKDLKTSDFLSLEVEDGNLVKRATKRLAINVKVGPSPKWLIERLQAQGQRSINNVVDITNYVMWVTGQPVHAFDYDKLVNKKITIGFAKNNEEITDLSGNKHKLDNTILVLSDGERSLDIAGIKGGIDSGVDENTTKVVLSAVNFDFKQIRTTAKKLKLHTDASKRFENEVPLNKIDWAMSLFSSLMEDIANAEVSDEILDTNPNYQQEIENKKIKITLKKINSLLGLELTIVEIKDILKRLDFSVEIEDETFYVLRPFERLDINIAEDVIEEIGRIYGYEKLPLNSLSENFDLPQINLEKESRNKVVDLLVSLGFFEVQNRTIVESGVIKLKNSLNANATCLRDNLLTQLKQRAEINLQFSTEPKLFEIGKIFTSYTPTKENYPIEEHFSFAGIIGKKKIKEKQKEELFYRTKGYLEKIFEILLIKNIEWKEGDEEHVSTLFANSEMVGKVGVNFWEINFEKLIKNIDTTINYKKVSKFPKIERDASFWVPENTKVLDVKKLFEDLKLVNLVELELFDIYKDKENNRKSFAFKFIFQSNEKTLTDDEINQETDKIYKLLEENKFEIR